MDLYVEIPLHYVIISIFIGYMYFYIFSSDYRDLLSLKTAVIGCVSGFSLSTIAVLFGLINANAFSLNEFVDTTMIIGILNMVMGVVLVMVGGTCAITVKRTLKNIKDGRV